jgi:hypothetical protein
MSIPSVTRRRQKFVLLDGLKTSLDFEILYILRVTPLKIHSNL